MTPWKNEPDFQDKRAIKQKFMQFWVDHLPRGLVLKIASHLYNVNRVDKINKEIEVARANIKN